MKAKISSIVIAATTSVALAGCGASASPDRTVDTFLHAAAVGDGSTACAQLSAQAKQQLVKGISCETGMKLLAGVFAAMINDLKLTDVRTQGSRATVVARYKGRPMTTYTLVKSGDKWLINRGRKMSTSSTTASTPPSKAQVVAVRSCLARKLEMPLNAGADSAGGVPMVVLTVQLGGYTKGMLEVFASASAARTAYPAVKAREAAYVVKLLRNSVVVYFKHVPAAKQRLVESCG